MMRTVYDQVGWVPQDKVNFDNTLKPLIDLDGELHWQSGVVTVSILCSGHGVILTISSMF